MEQMVWFIEKNCNTERSASSVLTKVQWVRLMKKLNAMGPPEKHWRGWRRVWNDLTNEVRKKIRLQNLPNARSLPLTVLQGRTLRFLQKREEGTGQMRYRKVRLPDLPELTPESPEPSGDDFSEDKSHQEDEDPLQNSTDSDVDSDHTLDEQPGFPEAFPEDRPNGQNSFRNASTGDFFQKAFASIEEYNRSYQKSLDGLRETVDKACNQMVAIQKERLEIDREKLKIKKEKLKLMKEKLEIMKHSNIITRAILIGGSSVFGLSMLCLATWPTKANVLLLSISAGINFATVFTIPFILIAQYHSTDTFKGKSPDGKERLHRGLGTDIAILNSSLFLAQIFISLTIGSLVSLTGSTSAVIYAAGVFSLCAALVANHVLYLD